MAKKTTKTSATNTVRNIRRKSRKRYSGEEKIRIVLEGLRGEEWLPNYAGEKASARVCTTAGAKSFSRPASSGSWVTSNARPTLRM